jgi:farnesyl diphosphate synthase
MLIGTSNPPHRVPRQRRFVTKRMHESGSADLLPRAIVPHATLVTENMTRTDALTEGLDIEALFQQRLAQIAQDTQALLDRLLGSASIEGEQARPARLIAAMRYASLGGGKRLRPFLVVESAALFGVSHQNSLMAGAALECVHCYSLVHDDLPAMDNDDLRRGRPTTHMAFDEATAVLAGDALLTFAFDILSRPETHADVEIRLRLVSTLARAAGLGGMVGGQMLDLAAEGRFEAKPPHLAEQDVKLLQAMKTAAILRFGCLAGAILGKADRSRRDALDRYGSALGEAFQIADDLLDVEGDPATVGKATGKDAAAHKATLVGVLGRAAARRRLEHLVAQAQSALEVFGSSADTLKAAARFVATRRA